MNTTQSSTRTAVSRRVLLGAGIFGFVAAFVPPVRAALAANRYLPTPQKPRYVLKIAHQEVNPDRDQVVAAITVNNRLPGPELHFTEGDIFRVQVENHMGDQPTSIHWHGLLLPNPMDGVPGLTQEPIPPGQTFVYEYPLRQSGTYWYHSHFQLQEQVGVRGPMVIAARSESLDYDRDYVVLLSDWLHSDPYKIIPNLRKQGNAQMNGTGNGMQGMTMDGGADLSDVAYPSFLLNGRGNRNPWAAVARSGERVRLRFINGSASTFFRVMVDGHPLTITHADGPAVKAVEVDNMLMGTAETYDALVTMGPSGSYTIRAAAQDGSGQAVGVLHTPDSSPRADLSKPRWKPRALDYAQLEAPEPATLPKGPDRSYDLALTGDMEKYVWSINGQVYPDADPLIVKEGERVHIAMENKTRMWHPMHLHGHFFRLIKPGADMARSPLKHTVKVPPGGRVRFAFAADNPGRWFFHCHNLYHLDAGMARVFVYRV